MTLPLRTKARHLSIDARWEYTAPSLAFLGLSAWEIITLAQSGREHMARYFFNIHNDTSVIDDIGSDHDDLDKVRAEAIDTVHEVSRGLLLSKGNVDAYVVHVTDALGATVLILSMTANLQMVSPAVPVL
jgi:hypothetical protein